jgi:hypothetical protein
MLPTVPVFGQQQQLERAKSPISSMSQTQNLSPGYVSLATLTLIKQSKTILVLPRYTKEYERG